MILNHGYNEVTNQEQIQAALEELQARLAVLKSPPSSPPSSFLKKLPRELRNEIYKLVLVKPILADPEAIHPRHEFGSSKKYELSPGLLRTNAARSTKRHRLFSTKRTPSSSAPWDARPRA